MPEPSNEGSGDIAGYTTYLDGSLGRVLDAYSNEDTNSYQAGNWLLRDFFNLDESFRPRPQSNEGQEWGAKHVSEGMLFYKIHGSGSGNVGYLLTNDAYADAHPEVGLAKLVPALYSWKRSHVPPVHFVSPPEDVWSPGLNVPKAETELEVINENDNSIPYFSMGNYIGPNYSAGKRVEPDQPLDTIDWSVAPKSKLDSLARSHDLCYGSDKPQGECDYRMIVDALHYHDYLSPSEWGAVLVILAKWGLGIEKSRGNGGKPHVMRLVGIEPNPGPDPKNKKGKKKINKVKKEIDKAKKTLRAVKHGQKRTRKQLTRSNGAIHFAPVSAPVARAKKFVGGHPRMSYNGDGVTITHEEYVSSFKTAGDSNWRIQQAGVINPTNSSLFPWLSNIAPNYEFYKFTKLIFAYEPGISTATSGTTQFVFDYDAVDKPPGTKAEMLQKTGFRMSPVWASNGVVFNPKAANRVRKYKVRTAGDQSDPNIDYDSAYLYISCDGTPANTIIGDLFVSYSVHLSISQSIPTSLSSSFFSITYYGPYNADLNSATYPFGKTVNSKTIVPSQSVSFIPDLNGATNGFKFVMPGRYMFYCEMCNNTSTYTTYSLPSGTQIFTTVSGPNGTSSVVGVDRGGIAGTSVWCSTGVSTEPYPYPNATTTMLSWVFDVAPGTSVSTPTFCGFRVGTVAAFPNSGNIFICARIIMIGGSLTEKKSLGINYRACDDPRFVESHDSYDLSRQISRLGFHPEEEKDDDMGITSIPHSPTTFPTANEQDLSSCSKEDLLRYIRRTKAELFG